MSDTSRAPLPHRSPRTAFNRRSMRRFEASPRRATPKGHTFMNCTAPPSPGPTDTTQPPAFVAHQLLQTGPMHRSPTDRGRLLHRLGQHHRPGPQTSTPRLEPLPLGHPTPPPALTYWRTLLL